MEYLSALAQPQTAWPLPSSAQQAHCKALPSRGLMHLNLLHYCRMLGQGHTVRPPLVIMASSWSARFLCDLVIGKLKPDMRSMSMRVRVWP